MRIQIKQLEGRDHYVVPCVMITHGVHCGSRGPIYYPPDELRRSVPFWNSRPVVIYHPQMYSNGYAGNPEVFNRQKVGHVFNTKFDGKRLTAEAWIDVERVKRVDSRVLDAIHNLKVMEVSTGLVFDDDGGGGEFNGKRYRTTARKMRPDHLAILPDQKGSCSIADGAGLIRNRQEVLVSPAMAF